MQDLGFSKLDAILLYVRDENIRQLEKWGIQEHSDVTWLAFLIEEMGELSAAMCEKKFRDGTNDEVFDEAIQVATLALKISEMVLFDSQEFKSKNKEKI